MGRRTKQRQREATGFYSMGLYAEALESAQRCRKLQRSPETTIALSVFAFEAFLNDLAEVIRPFTSDGSPEELQLLCSVLRDLENDNVQIRTKVALAYYILTRKRLDRGSLPYQDFHHLLAMRNAIVHTKPEYFYKVPKSERKPHPYLSYLSERGVIELNPEFDQTTWRIWVVRFPSVAVWAYNTAVDMRKFMLDHLPASPIKEHITTHLMRDLKRMRYRPKDRDLTSE